MKWVCLLPWMHWASPTNPRRSLWYHQNLLATLKSSHSGSPFSLSPKLMVHPCSDLCPWGEFLVIIQAMAWAITFSGISHPKPHCRWTKGQAWSLGFDYKEEKATKPKIMFVKEKDMEELDRSLEERETMKEEGSTLPLHPSYGRLKNCNDEEGEKTQPMPTLRRSGKKITWNKKTKSKRYA